MVRIIGTMRNASERCQQALFSPVALMPAGAMVESVRITVASVHKGLWKEHGWVRNLTLPINPKRNESFHDLSFEKSYNKPKTQARTYIPGRVGKKTFLLLCCVYF